MEMVQAKSGHRGFEWFWGEFFFPTMSPATTKIGKMGRKWGWSAQRSCKLSIGQAVRPKNQRIFSDKISNVSIGWCHTSRLFGVYMNVSETSGTPKSSIFIGFSIINHPFWGTPIFGNTHIISPVQTSQGVVPSILTLDRSTLEKFLFLTWAWLFWEGISFISRWQMPKNKILGNGYSRSRFGKAIPSSSKFLSLTSLEKNREATHVHCYVNYVCWRCMRSMLGG